MSEAIQQDLKSEKMRKMPIGKLLMSMSIPAMLSMLVQSLYNIVDSIYVANYDSVWGVEALSIAFPMQMLMMAFAIGIGVGCNVQIAKRLGEGRQKEASDVARTAIVMAGIMVVVFVVLGLTFSKPFANFFHTVTPATDTEPAIDNMQAVEMAASYLTIVISVNFGMFIEIVCSKIFQGTGNMKIPMFSQLLGAILNIALDPLFIFTFDMGARGAAIATVISQIIAMCFVVSMLLFRKHDVSISFKGFRMRAHNVLSIFIIGLPTMVMNAVGSLTTFFMNFILKRFTDAITVLGVYFKLQSFVFMPVFGLTQGALPILSYNYGWGNKKRYEKTFRLSVVISAGIMVAGLLLFQLAPDLLLRIFKLRGTAFELGKTALRAISWSFLPAAFSIIITTILQSLGKGINALIMSVSRQLALLIPIALLFTLLGSYDFARNNVWFAYPISEFLVMAVFLPVALIAVNTKFKAIEMRRKNSILLEKIQVAETFGAVPLMDGTADNAALQDIREAQSTDGSETEPLLPSGPEHPHHPGGPEDSSAP